MANIHIKTALDHIRRSPFQALAAVMVLSITFFVITIISILAYSTENAIKYFEKRPQVIAFIKTEVSEEGVMQLKSKLENDSRVTDLKYVSKEDAHEIYKQITSSNPLLNELVNPTIFPASLEFSLTDLSAGEALVNELKSEEIVDTVGLTTNLGDEEELTKELERLRKITWYLRLGGGAFAALLVSTSFLVLLIIIGMRMTSRRGEIEILDLIGASPGFVRVPVVIEALIYSLVGTVVGWLAALLITLYMREGVVAYFDQIPVLPADSLSLLQIFGLILTGEIFISIFLALSGSLLSVSRVRKRR